MASGIQGALFSNETILWQGKPRRLHLTSSDVVIFIVGSILMATSITMVILMYTFADEIPLDGVIFCIVFAGIAFCMSFGSVLFKLYIKANSNFYITDQRIVFRIQSFQTQTRIIELDNIIMMEKESITRSVGNIILCAKGAKSQSTYSDSFSAFYMINDVDDVYRLLYTAMQNNKNAAKKVDH